MPFRSQSQRAWMYANHPAMAKRWEKETPEGKLPEHVKKKKLAEKLAQAKEKSRAK